MNQIDAVRAMQNYIETHIYEKITLMDLSRVSFYSPWYSHRLFVTHLGLTPSDYIRKFKLSQSALELRDNEAKIIDIAFRYGYDSVDGYQRAFHKEFGTNPYEYSRNPRPISLFTPFKIYEKKEKKPMKKTSHVFITVITKPKRKVIIKRGTSAKEYFSYCEEVGCDVWGVLLSMKSISEEPVSLWLPKHLIKKDTSEYVQGVEVEADYEGEIPDGFDIIDLPEATYLMFQGEPFLEEDYEMAIQDLWEAMDKYEPSALGYRYDSSNPRIQLAPVGNRGYIELKPVVKI